MLRRKNMGLVRSDTRLRDEVSTWQSVRKLSWSVKSKKKQKRLLTLSSFDIMLNKCM